MEEGEEGEEEEEEGKLMEGIQRRSVCLKEER